jgi:hypothetical protein
MKRIKTHVRECVEPYHCVKPAFRKQMQGEQKSAAQNRQPEVGEHDAKEDVRGREPERGRDIFECWVESSQRGGGQQAARPRSRSKTDGPGRSALSVRTAGPTSNTMQRGVAIIVSK